MNTQTGYNRRHNNKLMFCVFVISVLFVMWFSGLHSAIFAHSGEVVKVGYYPMSGFHEYGDSGKPQGYDVDYLEELAHYANWEYEYVRTDSWQDALKLLDEGKIDIIGGMRMSDNIADKYSLSVYPAGSTFMALTALADNDELEYLDIGKFSSLKFGTVENDTRNNALNTYLLSANAKPEILYYEDFQKLRDALYAGEIDIMASDVMETNAKMKLIGKFAPASFYYAGLRDPDTGMDSEIMTTLNAKMARVEINKPGLIGEIDEKWYPDKFKVPLSRDELTFAGAHPNVKIGMQSSRKPMSWYDEKTSTMQGIIPSIFDIISEKSGIGFEYVPIPSGSTPINEMSRSALDMVVVISSSIYKDNEEITLSRSFLNENLAMFGRRGENFSANGDYTIALKKGFQVAEATIRENYPNFKIKTYLTDKECMEAVLKKDADFLMQASYVIEDLLQSPVYKDIEMVPTVSIEEEVCVAVPSGKDPTLLSIFDKTVDGISDEKIDQCIIKHTLAKSYKITLKDFFVEYQVQIICISVLIVLILAATIYARCQRTKVAKVIAKSEKMLSNITNNINGGVITMTQDANFNIIYANNGFLDLIGYTRDEFDSADGYYTASHIHKDDVAMFKNAIKGKHSGDDIELEIRIQNKKIGYIPVLFKGTLSKEDDSDGLMLFCVVVDISEQRKTMEELEAEKEHYKIAIEHSGDIIFDYDAENDTISCSPKYKEKFGWDIISRYRDDIPFVALNIFCDDTPQMELLADTIKSGAQTAMCKARIGKLDGTYIWCEIQVNRVSRPGFPIKVFGKIVDIDSIVKEHDRLTSLSQTDGLTGLYNKEAFIAALELFTSDKYASEQNGAVIFIDLDNFKTLNDTLGHLAGDKALKDVSEQLKRTFRSEDMIGRFGGDEFFVFLKNIPKSVLIQKLHRLGERLILSYDIGDMGEKVTISASAGIYEFNAGETTSEMVLERSDEALYYAKGCGKNNCKFYTQIK